MINSYMYMLTQNAMGYKLVGSRFQRVASLFSRSCACFLASGASYLFPSVPSLNSNACLSRSCVLRCVALRCVTISLLRGSIVIQQVLSSLALLLLRSSSSESKFKFSMVLVDQPPSISSTLIADEDVYACPSCSSQRIHAENAFKFVTRFIQILAGETVNSSPLSTTRRKHF